MLVAHRHHWVVAALALALSLLLLASGCGAPADRGGGDNSVAVTTPDTASVADLNGTGTNTAPVLPDNRRREERAEPRAPAAKIHAAAGMIAMPADAIDHPNDRAFLGDVMARRHNALTPIHQYFPMTTKDSSNLIVEWMQEQHTRDLRLYHAQLGKITIP